MKNTVKYLLSIDGKSACIIATYLFPILISFQFSNKCMAQKYLFGVSMEYAMYNQYKNSYTPSPINVRKSINSGFDITTFTSQKQEDNVWVFMRYGIEHKYFNYLSNDVNSPTTSFIYDSYLSIPIQLGFFVPSKNNKSEYNLIGNFVSVGAYISTFKEQGVTTDPFKSYSITQSNAAYEKYGLIVSTGIIRTFNFLNRTYLYSSGVNFSFDIRNAYNRRDLTINPKTDWYTMAIYFKYYLPLNYNTKASE
jgi:hypothetical protein